MFRSFGPHSRDSIVLISFGAWRALRGVMLRRALEAAFDTFGGDVTGGTGISPKVCL
ncbi:MAG: hypothetical protein ACKVP5_06810 [Aestuariivirga sp.]